MKKLLWFCSFILMFIVTPCFSSINCDGILRNGLRNIQISANSEASIATKYFNNCNKNFTSINDDQMNSAEVEIFGYGGGGGKMSRKEREERLTQWCKTNSSTAKNNKNSYEESQNIYGDAVAAWDNCNQLNSKDVIITPFISPDALDVDFTLIYTGNTSSGVKFYGVNARGFKCNVIIPKEGGVTEFNPSNPPEIKQEAISISCNRNPSTTEKINGQEYQVIPRGLITIMTASHPLQLYFPREYKPSLPEKRATMLEQKVKDLQQSISESKNKITDMIVAIENLDNHRKTIEIKYNRLEKRKLCYCLDARHNGTSCAKNGGWTAFRGDGKTPDKIRVYFCD